ncbi:hypothetical protein [Burkholderia glumae]|uniref:DUF4148 domain-containing protein n=1 Tax=Burkholderia glumae TaxID=337 RepID=A0ABY5BJF7_BURGL|nr:hypothetical protein [Burkholderia glumae]AJY65161.1 hypothetical protein KS03_759 [Burkholderia glumae LMG 2196 = ATCC 33617]MCM2481988.1 hypothetical protein [Burkholderia glumae]MCM2507869.1 hypothetical protein [Burkholderia glumae]MCM2536436.1 hypothetical protein [Burkholderia glumae]MCM2549119.1 hypothetical protein [Burkholderia glumae]
MKRRMIGSAALAAVALLASTLAGAKVQGGGGPVADVVLDHARAERQYRAIDEARRRALAEVRRNVALKPAVHEAGAAHRPT